MGFDPWNSHIVVGRRVQISPQPVIVYILMFVLFELPLPVNEVVLRIETCNNLLGKRSTIFVYVLLL